MMTMRGRCAAVIETPEYAGETTTLSHTNNFNLIAFTKNIYTERFPNRIIIDILIAKLLKNFRRLDLMLVIEPLQRLVGVLCFSIPIS